jgi:hypothetical protein
MRGIRLVLACAAVAAASRGAGAFTFSDGTTLRCVARGQPVEEYNVAADHPLVMRNHVGLVEATGSGYRIAWNATRLGQLPPVMHDFIFFHECAHASVPTGDELVANCVGLQAMRAAGRAGFAIEAKLSAFYGPASSYWTQTLACADAGRSPPPPPAPH